MNVTSTAVSANSYLTVYPYNGTGPVPNVSALNPVRRPGHPEPAGGGTVEGWRTANYIQVYNYGGYLHYLADVTAVILSD